ncbi:hypothetical protein E4U42_000323 [Claviceps africana]|uniref:Uncharacterized protein n=1 Tax=Claviceps africana TaxID=83212 RepID=A0A8K0JA28_9HYPO|nr:hypothetical protein E4U42_000323 [Claviceps africana]
MAAETWATDFAAPFEVDTLLEVRVSGMNKMPGLNVPTGIDKKPVDRPVKVNKMGLEGDWHDLTFHGGPDKAILGYCSSHYPNWATSYPDRREKFVPGGFGENLVTPRMNERNVCIGDVVSVGPEVQLQVSLPRQPCFKLNHRFSLKNFAPVTYQTSRTGWYYRVVQEGTVRAGDEIRLVERRHPRWTIERVQEYLHRDKDNLEMNRLLAELEALGEESRGQFRNRVARATRKKAPRPPGDEWTDYSIIERRKETPTVISLTLQRVAAAAALDPDAAAERPRLLGAHARLKLRNGLIRTYSVVSSSRSRDVLELGIALAQNSRGGSRHLHHDAKVHDTIQVGRLTTDVRPDSAASNHVFIASGIGITAFVALLQRLTSIHWSCELHYAVRSAADVPFADRLAALPAGVVTLYDKSRGQRMDIPAIVRSMPWNSHIYACGPSRMMQAVRTAVHDAGIPPSEVHYEAFTAETSGDPFDVEVAHPNGTRLLHVGPDETLLDVLRRDFPDAPSSCEVGNCGTCKVVVRAGRVHHRGTALSAEEKHSAMLACVSRGIGQVAISLGTG